MPILLNKINIQGLPVAERANYDFVKATTLTDFLALTEEPFYIKKQGKYSFYDDFDEYYLLFSINYTPTIIQDNGDKQVVFNWEQDFI